MAISENKQIPLILIGLLLFAGTAFADSEPEITITDLKGEAFVREAGDYMWRRPEAGQMLFAGDHLQLRSGELRIAFPQATLQVFDRSRLELPVELVDGFAEPWNNDLVLLIGSFEVSHVGSLSVPPLKITTSFGQIVIEGSASFTLRNDPGSSNLNVLSGQVTVRHRWKSDLPPAVVSAGSGLLLTSKGLRPMTDRTPNVISLQ